MTIDQHLIEKKSDSFIIKNDILAANSRPFSGLFRNACLFLFKENKNFFSKKSNKN
jgi:hypothetical protein